MRSTADAGGGLKIGRYGFRFHRGLGAVSHQQAGAGIYQAIACYYYQRPKKVECCPHWCYTLLIISWKIGIDRKEYVMKIRDFKIKEIGTIQIDWEKIEEHMGFAIHKDLKDFYSRDAGKDIKDIVDFTEAKFVIKTGDERNDTWFSFNSCEGKVEYTLELLSKNPQDAIDTIDYVFSEWTGGNDFGHRACIGQFYFNIGEILILFNNDTGKIEWIDCGYGYFDIYEENPNGILANSIQEFLEKF